MQAYQTSTAAVAIQIGIAAHHEARAPNVRPLVVERRLEATRDRFDVTFATRHAATRNTRPVDAVLHERSVLLDPRLVGRADEPALPNGSPPIFYIDALVGDAHGQKGAHDGQPNGAAPRAHELARRLARALGRAAVARELAAVDARRQVGAAGFNVGARLGREALARKLRLAAQKNGQGWGMGGV
tara:strand:+ start:804 stop:1361 length:558 start_codon:yes stop_codon:yes gene_type:complete